jgi:hypothetical protein
MKKTITLLLMLMLVGFGYAQSSGGFNYKALLTDNGNPVTTPVDVKVTIEYYSALGGIYTIAWQEEHTNIQPDNNGIFSINMGKGTRLSGTASDFNDIYFGSSMFGSTKYTIEVNSGSGYQTLVNRENFKDVPVAKTANKANKAIKLNKQYGEILFDDNADGLKFESDNSGNNIYQFVNSSNGFEAKYNSGVIFTLHGSSQMEISNDLKVNGKVLGDNSGDSDMKACIYGRLNPSGTIVSGASSDGFSPSREDTGHYRITFNQSPGSDNYIVTATAWDINGPQIVTYLPNSNFVDIYIWDKDGNPVDSYFDFVVYKK